MYLALQGLLQVLVSWYLLIVKGPLHMMHSLSSISALRSLLAFITQLSEQYLTCFVLFDLKGFKHTWHTKSLSGRSAASFFAFSLKNFLPTSVYNQACIFLELALMRFDNTSLSSYLWRRQCSL